MTVDIVFIVHFKHFPAKNYHLLVPFFFCQFIKPDHPLLTALSGIVILFEEVMLGA